MEKTPLTKELLVQNGWIETGDEVFYMKKPIENRNPLNASEDSDIHFTIHRMYNSNTFAIVLPDGGMLNFVANTLEDLQIFESMINFYDPPF